MFSALKDEIIMKGKVKAHFSKFESAFKVHPSVCIQKTQNVCIPGR